MRKCNILIKGNRIASIDHYNCRLPSGIKVIKTNGGFVLPGFVDSHTHLLAHGIELQRIDLANCRSPGQCLEKMAQERDKNNNILFGVNWDDSDWHRGKADDISKQSLDRITSKIPVIMRRICGHFAICNSRALASIPQQWKIINRKTGYLYEDAALYLNEIFPPSETMFEKGLEKAMKEALSLGITSVHEIIRPKGFFILQKLRNKLQLRFSVYLQEKLDEAVALGLCSGTGDDSLKFSGIKYYLDGSIGAKTAALKKPYRGSRKRGGLLLNKKQLMAIINQAERHGLQLMIHSIGDRASELLVDSFGSCGLKSNSLRHRIEHLEYVDDRSIEQILRLRLLLSMQPNFVVRWQNPNGMYEKSMGARVSAMNCFQKLAEHGAKIMFGSDSMPMGPLFGLRGAVNHPFKSGRIPPAQALLFYTANGAYGSFDENAKGKIAAGMLADMVLVDKNPLIENNLQRLRIRDVFFGGKLIFSASG